MMQRDAGTGKSLRHDAVMKSGERSTSNSPRRTIGTAHSETSSFWKTNLLGTSVHAFLWGCLDFEAQDMQDVG